MNGIDILGLEQENKRLKGTNNNNQTNDWMANFVAMPEEQGVVVVRLLGPAIPGMFDRPKSPFFQATRIHKVNEKNIHCLKHLEGEKWVGECPVCLYYNHLWKESEKKSPDEAKALQARAREIKPFDRYYYNCIVRKETDKNGVVHENVGPKILSVGKTLHKLIIRAIMGDEELQEPALGDVTDIRTGRDFKISKTIRNVDGQKYPNYDSSRFLESSALDPDQVKIWLENLHDLVALRLIKDHEDVKTELKKHLGLIPNDNDGTGFDPSEYEVGRSEVVVREVPKVLTESVQRTEETVDNNLEGLNLETDFLEELRKSNV